VETDWYAHETEFRYVRQPGEGISATHSMPIGQVFLARREEISLQECIEEKIEAIDRSAETLPREKAGFKLTTGLQSVLLQSKLFTEGRSESPLLFALNQRSARRQWTVGRHWFVVTP